MKNIFRLSLIAALLAVITVSCEMERYPFDKIEQSQAFKTIDDATALRNGIYAGLRNKLDGIYMFTTDIQADIFNASLAYGNRNGAPHDWVNFLATDYTLRDMWRQPYAALVDVNNFIENIDGITAEDAAEQELLNKYKGEAFFFRAFYYHMLVKRYAKDYEPASADSDPGVPLVLSFDITLLPERASISEVYNQVIADLAQAKLLLSGVNGSQSANEITADAVTALEARVKLDMHDYAGAITAADELISSESYPLITDQAEFTAMWLNDESTEVIFQYPLSAPSELANGMGLYLNYNPDPENGDYYVPDWIPQQWAIDQYDVTDIRRSAYFEQKEVLIEGTRYPGIWCLNKFAGNPDLYAGANTNYQNEPKVFRIAEMYLIVAEAGAQNPATETDALTALNDLRSARGLTPLAGLTGTALMDEVKAERTRELLGEGMRLDDLKRWSDGFSRTTPQNTNIIVTGVNFSEKVVTADDPKFVWGIPANDITTNPNIADQQNPGW